MDPRINSALSRLSPMLPDASALGIPADEGSGASSFQAVLGGLLQADATANAKANQAIEQLATGQAQDVHSVALAVAEADLTFRLLLELRNRATEAYQEVMRMQI